MKVIKRIVFLMAALCCLFLLSSNQTKAATTTYKTGYVRCKTYIKLYENKKLKSKVVKKLKHGTQIKYKRYSKNWYYAKVGNKKGFIQKRVIQNYVTKIRMAKSTTMKYTNKYFKRMGVIYWNNWRWTWYSQRVLPGGGLRIPGRHVNKNGYVCDESGYICLASSKLKKGTVVETPFGSQGKIYDSGCARNTLDVYVNW